MASAARRQTGCPSCDDLGDLPLLARVHVIPAIDESERAGVKLPALSVNCSTKLLGIATSFDSPLDRAITRAGLGADRPFAPFSQTCEIPEVREDGWRQHQNQTASERQ